MLDPQVAERLVGLAVMALKFLLEFIRKCIILIFKSFPDRRKGLKGMVAYSGHYVRMPDSPVGFPGPERDVVQGNPFPAGSSVDEGAQPAVAQRQRLFEIIGRMVIMHHETVFAPVLRARSREEGERQGQQFQCFHG